MHQIRAWRICCCTYTGAIYDNRSTDNRLIIGFGEDLACYHNRLLVALDRLGRSDTYPEH